MQVPSRIPLPEATGRSSVSHREGVEVMAVNSVEQPVMATPLMALTLPPELTNEKEGRRRACTRSFFSRW